MKSVAGRIIFLLAMIAGQSADIPSYVREGNRAEQELRAHRDSLAQFLQSLRGSIQKEISPAQGAPLLEQLRDAPPQPGVYGYQILPRITNDVSAAGTVTSFTYSWAITRGYVNGETQKLGRARADLELVAGAPASAKQPRLSDLVRTYGELLSNHKTIDQYIQYNRFWQRSIALDRPRFDQLNELYLKMKAGNPDTAGAIRNVLGTPLAPRFLRVQREGPRQVMFDVPLYTDIDDPQYLSEVRKVIESTWRAEENGTEYALRIHFQVLPASRLYPDGDAPQKGTHINVAAHTARFPSDGGVLTTGAEFTHGAVGRYVALGPGDLAPRTLAHEFGHLLGFNDGYIRGYRDLGDEGFEILELTSFFDDIMSAPRQGNVQTAHFRLLIEALSRASR